MTSQNIDTHETTFAATGEREIRVERIFDAPRTRVWATLSRPELVAQWWGRGNPVTIEQMQFERGGHWRVVEHAPSGEYGFEGRYREIVPESRIERTFEWDGAPGHVLVETLELRELDGDRTLMVMTSLFHTGEDRDAMIDAGMEGGMRASYAALDDLIAART